ncbi:glycosyl transferase [Cylindrospermopsis raciborskii S07]|uniref:glycosyltransferase family 2 protein n=1 Tax=Cylindrospermopsis raciborskii TaxID=77022 RepID=UPI000C9E124C|nr:glycosyltransferase [Cylindrospermopsis raciborskii]PNK08028.1 glycosyl transferase [Cylindrospermopsis raciborskii S10]PNK09655.1 glycosyl transferase [Cylindrospermopsis raciborskii S07]PNK10355.1 glycosyl transferase [Cylindrospermopsis raciborskii S14]PNK16522.1 glycosyl transferase [Cylindrospermopsis raciborskii S06]PNK20964.1 glycosyl transferase [Cylindrospermopsis raciborskii S05]
MSSPELVSIVICTLNRCCSLEKTLKSLNQINYRYFEVIIIDSSDDESTRKMVDELKMDLDFPIQIFRSSVKNISVSRNMGTQKSSGKIVAFIDDDAIPQRDWLDKLLATYTLKGDKCAGVGGSVKDMTKGDLPWQYYQGITNVMSHTIPIRLGKVPNHNQSHGFWYNGMMGTNSSYRKELLEKINGYDEFFDYFLDETDVCLRLIQAGYEIHYCDTIVHHYPQPSHNRYDQKHLTCWYSLAKNTTYFALKHGYNKMPYWIFILRLSSLLIYRCLLRILRLKFSHNLNNHILLDYIKQAIKGISLGWSYGVNTSVHSSN